MQHLEPELRRIIRYGIVGLTTNACMYSIYLGLAALGVGPKTAMSLLYAPAVLLAFVGNRGFTFRHRGAVTLSLARYLASYALGFVFCFAALLLLVDWLGLAPNPVVLGLIPITAVMLYWLQRVWVFPSGAPLRPEAGLQRSR